MTRRWLPLVASLVLACAPADEPCAGGACEQELDGAGVSILSFTASPAVVPAGEPATLAWSTRDAAACGLSPEAGVVPRSGSLVVRPQATTRYTLRCEGAVSSVSEEQTVEVLGEDLGRGSDDGGLPESGDGGDPQPPPDGGEAHDGGVVSDDGGVAPEDAGDQAPDAGPPLPLPTSCADLRVRRGVTVDGLYLLDPDGAGDAFEAWCDMTTEGGGWALVLKADGAAPTFAYEASLWTSEELLSPDEAAPDPVEAKLEGYLRLPVDRVRLTLEGEDGVERGMGLALQGASLLEIVATEAPVATEAGREAWLALLPGAVLQPHCDAEGVNVQQSGEFVRGRVRLGILGNNEDNCDTPDSWLGVGAHGVHRACGSTAELALSAGATACYLPGVHHKHTVEKPAFARVWVRDEDFTDLPPLSSCEEHLEAGRTVSGHYRLSEGSSETTAFCDMTGLSGG